MRAKLTSSMLVGARRAPSVGLGANEHGWGGDREVQRQPFTSGSLVRARWLVCRTAVACSVAAVFAVVLPGPASAAGAPPPVAWREAAKLATMPIFEPTSLFGISPTTPYVSVTPPMTAPRCQFLFTSYAHGLHRLAVSEVLNYRECGNLGDVKVVKRVRVGAAVATIYACGTCTRAVPIEITWTARGTFIDLNWSSMTLNHVIDVARGMKLVPRPPTISPGTASGADQTSDASYVLAHNPYCTGYPSCSLVFQQTTDGQGHPLIAVDLLAVGATACGGFGITYFFDGTTFLTSTNALQPKAGVWAGSRPVWVAGSGEFGVNFPVSSSSSGPCSDYGDLGVDTFIYKWNGAGMAVAYGQKPRAPAVLH